MSDVLVCAPVDYPCVDGSTVAKCSICDGEVWVAPSGRALIDMQSLEINCLPCALELADSSVTVQAPNAEQVAEIHDYLKGKLQ